MLAPGGPEPKQERNVSGTVLVQSVGLMSDVLVTQWLINVFLTSALVKCW